MSSARAAFLVCYDIFSYISTTTLYNDNVGGNTCYPFLFFLKWLYSVTVRSEDVVRKGGIFGFSEEITVFLIFLTQVDYNKI